MAEGSPLDLIRARADRLKTNLLGARERMEVFLTAYRKLLRQTKRGAARTKAHERELAEMSDRIGILGLELKRERDRERGLLESVLPESVARRIADNAHAVIADEFPEATVLSACVADFDKVSEGLGSRRLVESLNQLYSVLDVMAAERGIEKVRSSGERYLCVSGAPLARPDHAEAIAEFALDLSDMLRKIKVGERTPLALKIGIASGPLVAGVVGERKYVWDVFGPSVKACGLIEGLCYPGKALANVGFALKLRDRYRFTKAQVPEGGIPGIDEVFYLEARLPKA
jgi:adenylate cyclase